jgi:hypothetical protein
MFTTRKTCCASLFTVPQEAGGLRHPEPPLQWLWTLRRSFWLLLPVSFGVCPVSLLCTKCHYSSSLARLSMHTSSTVPRRRCKSYSYRTRDAARGPSQRSECIDWLRRLSSDPFYVWPPVKQWMVSAVDTQFNQFFHTQYRQKCIAQEGSVRQKWFATEFPSVANKSKKSNK